MDLNSITLSPSIIARLYKQTLVTEVKPQSNYPELENSGLTTIVEEPGNNLKSLGNNLRNILVVVDEPGYGFVPDEQLKFLTEILTACKISLADIALVNLATVGELSYKELTSTFGSRIVLLFDVPPVRFGLPLDFPHYQIQPFGAVSYLYSPGLGDLESDKLQKSKLWVSLKRLFNI